MKNKIAFLFLCATILINCTVLDVKEIHLNNKCEQFDNDNNQYDILFMGDSITEGGNFEQIIPNSKNVGIGGASIYKTEAVIPHVAKYNPNRVYIMIGINSLIYYSYEDCEKQYTSLINKIKDAFYNADIILESVLPTSDNKYQIARFNEFIKQTALSNGFRYTDLYSLYAVGGVLPSDITTDGIHLIPSAYDRWYNVLKNDIGQ